MNLTAQKGGGVGCKQQNEHTRLCEHTARELGALGVGVALLGLEGKAKRGGYTLLYLVR